MYRLDFLERHACTRQQKITTNNDKTVGILRSAKLQVQDVDFAAIKPAQDHTRVHHKDSTVGIACEEEK